MISGISHGVNETYSPLGGCVVLIGSYSRSFQDKLWGPSPRLMMA